MRRRQFLAGASIALIAGCTGAPGTDGGDGETQSVPTGEDETATSTSPSDTPTSTPTWSPGGTAEMGPDTNMVELSVTEAFDGRVELDGSCTLGGEPVTLEGGESIEIKRDEPGDGCSYRIRINESLAESGGVAGYETAMIDVTADGSVDVSVLAV